MAFILARDFGPQTAPVICEGNEAMPVQCAPMNSMTKQLAEVSGWDAEGQFFVEIADLDCSDPGQKTVSLGHRLHSGSLVFVRLINRDGSRAGENSHPTAHEAQAVRLPDSTERSTVRLIPSPPRVGRRGSDHTGATRI